MLSLLGVPISRLGLEEAASACERRIREGSGGFACFVNVHSLTESTSNAALKGAFDQSWQNFADGMPLLWASQLKGLPVSSRACGPDLMELFLTRQSQFAHAFLGSSPEVCRRLSERFGLNLWSHSPPHRPFSPEHAQEDWNALLAARPEGAPAIPDCVWVGLGAPKQELWMSEVSKLAPRTLFFGVGAAFDFLGGTKARAPEWIQRSGLEWAHRMASEPRRLLGRYAATNSKFAYLLLKELVSSR